MYLSTKKCPTPLSASNSYLPHFNKLRFFNRPVRLIPLIFHWRRFPFDVLPQKIKKQGRNRSFCLVSGGDMRDRTADLLNAIVTGNWIIAAKMNLIQLIRLCLATSGVICLIRKTPIVVRTVVNHIEKTVDVLAVHHSVPTTETKERFKRKTYLSTTMNSHGFSQQTISARFCVSPKPMLTTCSTHMAFPRSMWIVGIYHKGELAGLDGWEHWPLEKKQEFIVILKIECRIC